MTPNWGALVLLLSVFILGLVLLAGSGELWLALWCAGLLVVSFPLFVWIARRRRKGGQQE